MAVTIRASVREAGFVVPSLVLGLAIVLAAILFGLFHYRSRAARDTIQVTGVANQPFDSDVVKWRVVLSRQVGPTALREGYTQLAADLEALMRNFEDAGIAEGDIGVQPVNAYPRFDNFGERVGFNLQQSVYVISNQVPLLEGLALNPNQLIEQGIVLESSQLEYFYSRIDSLKHDLLARATEDARRRAERIATGSGLSIDRIASARAGVFQITEPYSTEVTDYGVHNTTSKKKEITVTVHATFVAD